MTNGKVLLDAATTSGGNITDSIHMNVEFSDDPGTVYTLAGYRRTGFLEDEH
ncbi:lipid-binding protein [Antarcticibacterium sp. 1MA-6-2]|uniref:lipid-binding protein n=1 Tax=Antarcticibacterium sp. 1MA-6-2 TaxID=2908210 RepID=UPI0038FC45F3